MGIIVIDMAELEDLRAKIAEIERIPFRELQPEDKTLLASYNNRLVALAGNNCDDLLSGLKQLIFIIEIFH